MGKLSNHCSVSYCVKDASGQVHQEGKVGTTRWALDGWMKTLPQPSKVAMEATIFTGWIYNHLLPHAQQAVARSPLRSQKIQIRPLLSAPRREHRLFALGTSRGAGTAIST